MNQDAREKRRPSTTEDLIALGEASLLFYGLHEWSSKTAKAVEPSEILQDSASFIENNLAATDVLFTFIGPDTQLLQRAAERIARHAERDPALAKRRGRSAWHRLGERTYFELSGRSRPIGYISLVDATQDEQTQRHTHLLLEILATQLGVLCENAVLNHQMRELSRRDPLTGLMNRRALEESMHTLIRQQTAATLYMIDIDQFKSINDTFGHATGDEVLKVVGHTLSSGVRACDLAARYGGEEMTVILRDVDMAEIRVAGESLRKRIEQIDWQDLGLERPVTVSVGAAARVSGDAESQSWIRRADEALYLAKEAGRNRVVVWSPTSTGISHTEWVSSPEREHALGRTHSR